MRSRDNKFYYVHILDAEFRNKVWKAKVDVFDADVNYIETSWRNIGDVRPMSFPTGLAFLSRFSKSKMTPTTIKNPSRMPWPSADS